MTDMACVNGAIMPLAEASISVLDRGFLFADGVYEVVAVLDGGLVDLEPHMRRLERSLGEVGIGWPVPAERIAGTFRMLLGRARLHEGYIYLQITRGDTSERDFLPTADAAPNLVMFTHAKPVADVPAARTGIAVASVPDRRWARRDIKSTALLAQVLAKREAAASGCQEAWMVEDGVVTEGASSTAFIVRGRRLVTRSNSVAILPGCTRQAVQMLAEERGVDVEERSFSIAEAQASDEAFVTSATNFVMPVVRIDGKAVGDGAPGPLASRLRDIYIAFARSSALEEARADGRVA
jgi:D-alanine transaminase